MAVNHEKIETGKRLIDELTRIIRELSDAEVAELLGNGPLDTLIRSILDPADARQYPSIAEFLLAKKNRGALLALARYAITRNYAFKPSGVSGEAYVSPHFTQWFSDGVVFLEGREPFTGLIGLYRNGEIRYAVAARDARGGEQLGPADLRFMSVEDWKANLKSIPPEQITELERPLNELRELLERGEVEESNYQELIQKYPWILGAEYGEIQDHRKLDDRNIPDFTGVRVRDKYRDMIEIKSPYITVSRKDGELSSEFNDAWNQAERYVNFVREDSDYLRHKGLNFDLPRCFLIAGYRVPPETLAKIRGKEKLNPTITFLTYEDLEAYVRNTIQFVKKLRSQA
jgi:hypothetical protein